MFLLHFGWQAKTVASIGPNAGHSHYPDGGSRSCCSFAGGYAVESTFQSAQLDPELGYAGSKPLEKAWYKHA